MKKSLQRAWEQASIYLPVLLMAMLALGTWWLVRNAPKPLQEKTQQVASTDPDYTMDHFSVVQFDASGRTQSVISGLQARHLPLTDTTEVDEVQTRSFSPDGMLTTSSAKRGISNADGSEIQLWGNAVVQRIPVSNAQQGMKLEGEFLHAWIQEERVKSHLPVVITRGNNRFTGNRLDYDHLSQVLILQGKVRGLINK